MRQSIKASHAAVVALVLTFVTLGYVAGNQASRSSADREIAWIKDQLDSLKSQQEALQEVYRSGNPRRRAGAVAGLGYPPLPPFAPEWDPGPDEMMLSVQGEKRKLDQAFSAERVDPAWAGTATATVQDALVNIASQPGFPVPDDAKVECRSQSCRIVMTLDDLAATGQLSDSLLADISELLPQAELVELPSSDGMRIELHIYAATLPPPT